jgi:hypothetical protein
VGLVAAQSVTVGEGASTISAARRGGGGALLLAHRDSHDLTLVEFTAHRHVVRQALTDAMVWQGQVEDPWLRELAPDLEGPHPDAGHWLELNRDWLGEDKVLEWLTAAESEHLPLGILVDLAAVECLITTSGPNGESVRFELASYFSPMP